MNLNDRCNSVALYDVDAQKLIGVFSSHALCSMYVWGKCKPLNGYIKNKSKNKKNTLNLHVCFRAATSAQKPLIGKKQFHIEPAYKDRTEELKLSYKVRKQFGGGSVNSAVRLRQGHLQDTDVTEIRRLFTNNVGVSLIAKRFRTSIQTIYQHTKDIRIEKKLSTLPDELLLQELKNRGITT